MKFEDSLAFARQLDKNDPLKSYRKLFFIPKQNGKELIYFSGNSLGLQPKTVEKHLKTELTDWKNLGVEAHLEGKNPWLYYHHFFARSIARLVGGKEKEVVVMNQLTVNLNLLLISFYRPTGKKNKILVQANEFPSDYYAIEQQIKLHGLEPAECIIEVMPKVSDTLQVAGKRVSDTYEDEVTLRTDDIIAKIEKHKDELALVMFSAVNYYTGQFFEVEKISAACKKYNILFGLDLAHAIGNVELKLHKWNVDFATWCSYKYLNSGPGGVSGIFIHEKHANNFSIPRLAGWWGNNEKTRFQMLKHFVPQSGAAGWQISNAPVLSMAAHKASLEIFDKAGMKILRKKSELLTAYLLFLLADTTSAKHAPFRIITPTDKAQRGCQLSIQTTYNGKKLFERITRNNIVADWRDPDVIRIAPVPLYNKFEEAYVFAKVLKEVAE